MSKIKDRNTYIERDTVFYTNHLLTTKRDNKDSERKLEIHVLLGGIFGHYF